MAEIIWSRKFSNCIICGTNIIPHKAKGLCNNCYQSTHSYPEELCSVCNKISRVHARIDDKPVCKSCYLRPSHKCTLCGNFLPSALVLSDGEYVCFNCYNSNFRSREACSQCGDVGILAVNSKDKKICINCYRSKYSVCEKCGRSERSPYIIGNLHVCNRCYERSKKNEVIQIDITKTEYKCSTCGSSNNVHRLYADGSIICPDCYSKYKGICFLCKNPLQKIHSHINALPYCRSCYYKKKVEDYLELLKSKYKSDFLDVLSLYFINKSKYTCWEASYERLLSMSRILDLVYSGYSINSFTFSLNSLLDIARNYPSSKMFINDFLHFLSSEKIICDFNNGFSLLYLLNDRIEKLPDSFKTLAFEYKKHLLKRVEIYHKHGWVNESQRFRDYTCYLYLLTAIRFFEIVAFCFLTKHPAEINDHLVDNFLKMKPYDKGNLRHFIKFINKQKITFTSLKMPNTDYINRLQLGLSADKQKEIITLCLNDVDSGLRNKLLILLLLCYGLTAEEVRNLEKSSFTFSKKSKNCITFEHNGVSYKLIPTVSSMVLEYMRSLNPQSSLMFPGRQYLKPLSISSICLILESFGVTSRQLYYTSVNNALTNGVSQPALLMRLFGIHYTTATKYYNFVKHLYYMD